MELCDATPPADSPSHDRETLAALITPSGPASLSPSLQPHAETPAYELKFLVDPILGSRVLHWARQNLFVDPHADPKRDGIYEVHTLYFDTPQFDVFLKSEKYKRKKYRLRRYGMDANVFLEEKRKIGEQVAKRRAQVPVDQLTRLQEPLAGPDWEGTWFQRRLERRRLVPTCQISYERHAFFGECTDGPLRLTLDRALRGQRANGWQFAAQASATPLLDSDLLLELKYRAYLPAIFKRMLQDFNILSRSLSKYRLAFRSCGFELPQGVGDA